MRTRIAIVVLAITAICGCLSFGTAAQDESGNLPMATVKRGEPTLETVSEGCAKSVDQLPRSYHIRLNDPRLRHDGLMVVVKRERRIMLFSNGEIRHDRQSGYQDCWRIALGADARGRSTGVFDKLMTGDRRTPEGWFRTSDKPWSSFYGAIQIHYPSERHAAQALNRGSIDQTTYVQIAQAEESERAPPQNTPLGGELLIHGGGSRRDWTEGCVALNDQDMDELRALLPDDMRTWLLILP